MGRRYGFFLKRQKDSTLKLEGKKEYLAANVGFSKACVMKLKAYAMKLEAYVVGTEAYSAKLDAYSTKIDAYSTKLIAFSCPYRP